MGAFTESTSIPFFPSIVTAYLREKGEVMAHQCPVVSNPIEINGSEPSSSISPPHLRSCASIRKTEHRKTAMKYSHLIRSFMV